MRIRCAAALALLTAGALPAAAQDVPYGVACAGQRINAITVRPLPPLEHPSKNWWDTPVSMMNSSHTTTKAGVISALLLFQVGEPCIEYQRLESERVLRAQPFIADAHIEIYADSGGTVSVIVNTQDEFTFILAGRFSGRSPYVTSLTVGDGDLGGSGSSLAVNWTHTVDREGFGAAFTSYAFLGNPWQLQLAAARGATGVSSYLGDISHPFYSDAQRNAWRGSVVDATLLTPFQRADTAAFSLIEERQFFYAGSAQRLGKPGSVTLLGLALSSEYDASSVPPTGVDSTVDYDSLLARYAPRRSVRLNLLAQYRHLAYQRGVRLATVNSSQDIRTGVEFDAHLARGFGGFDKSVADVFASSGLFLGAGSRLSFTYLQLLFEARRGDGAEAWTDAIGSARARWYHRVTETNTLIFDGEFGGGWRTTRPFELNIGQPDGGVRGYGASHDAGGSRAAIKLENRWFAGTMRNRVDLGLAAFVDAGKVWAGDVPYGTTTPVKVGVGVGLLAATPVGSRRTYRMDIAFPVSPDKYARWEVRLTVINIAELGAILEPIDVRFGREFVSTSASYTYPR